MKFIHVGDTHLGKSEGKNEERRNDFYRTFSQVIDFAIKENVDFVAHTGDLFDNARPSVSTVVFVIQELKKLKEKNIPFLIIAGSHDIGVGDTIITVLEEAGFLKNLSSSKYVSVEDNNIILGGEKIRDCFVCGIAGKRVRIDEVYSKIKVKSDSPFKVFMFHHTISDVSEKFADIATSLLPRGFDYYAGGHWHGFFETSYDGAPVVYPGSTEFCDLSEAEHSKERYFCLVKLGEKTSFEKIKLDVRKVAVFEFSCDGLKATEVANECINYIQEDFKDGILWIKLKGKLSQGTKSEIDREAIINWGKEKSAFMVNISLSRLENPESPFVSPGIKTSSEMEKEYLEKQGYSENEIKLAKDLIKILGKKLTPSEHEVSKNQAIEIVLGELIEDKKD